MEERGPWGRVLIAGSVAAIIAALAVAAFQLGQFAVAFELFRSYFVGQGISPDDAGDVASGALQTLVDLVFLTGVLAMFGFVDRGFKKHARRRQAARSVLNAYVSFVRALVSVRNAQGEKTGVVYTQLFAARLARLRRSMDELSTRPFFFADVFPEPANDAIESMREKLSYFYAVIDYLGGWAAAESADPKRQFFTVFIRYSNPQKATDFVVSFHSDMLAFFKALHPAQSIQRKLRGELAGSMNAMAAIASRFVTVERPRDDAVAAEE